MKKKNKLNPVLNYQKSKYKIDFFKTFIQKDWTFEVQGFQVPCLLAALVLVPAVKRKLDFHAVKGPAGVEIGYTEP